MQLISSKLNAACYVKFYNIKFDFLLSEFKNYDLLDAKMALISEKREGYIVFYNHSFIVSNKNLEIKTYNLKEIERELLEIVRTSLYTNQEEIWKI